jgi:hypothetical protein
MLAECCPRDHLRTLMSAPPTDFVGHAEVVRLVAVPPGRIGPSPGLASDTPRLERREV